MITFTWLGNAGYTIGITFTYQVKAPSALVKYACVLIQRDNMQT